MKRNDIDILEYLYLNRSEIFEILYREEKVIPIEIKMINKLSDYYYLYYLINDCIYLINFIFDLKFIKHLYDIINNTEFYIKKIILTKIMKTFINNIETNEKEEEHELEKMGMLCYDIIEKYKNQLNQNIIGLDIDKLTNDDIWLTEIYSDIIKSLIINNKLNESEETINLLKEIEIKNIRLDKHLFDSLSEVLIDNYISRYEILNYDDLFNDEKISFYFVLFEYILKSSDYVFHIPFLKEMRNNIKEIIRNNPGDFSFDIKNENNKFKNNKLKIVLGYFIERDYYIQKGVNMKRNKAIKKQIDSEDLKIKANVSNPIQTKDLKSEEDASSDSFTSSRYLDYDDIKDTYPTVLDFMTNSYFYNQNHIYDYLKQIHLSYLNKENALFILSESIFTLSIEYKKEKDETVIKYKKIICKNVLNEEEELNIEEVKNLTSKINKLNYYYQNFLVYLNKFEKELKNFYKTEKKIEIELRFKMSNFSEFIVNCDLIINNEEFEEKCFKDENILKFSAYERIYLMIETLNER